MTTQQPLLPVASSSSSSSSLIASTRFPLFSHCLKHRTSPTLFNCNVNPTIVVPFFSLNQHRRLRRRQLPRYNWVRVGDTESLFGNGESNSVTAEVADEDEEEEVEPTPEDLEYIGHIKRVLELLRKNRDMLFSEVKLTVMIEDPREVERRRLLGIDDSDGPTREDLVVALEEVNEGKVPKDRVALRILAEEMLGWPNLEAEAPKKKGKNASLYAKATDTGIAPEVAAKKLNVDWDSAAEIEEAEITDSNEVPSALGYGALYLVTAFPVIIGIAVVLILFYNSLQ